MADPTAREQRNDERRRRILQAATDQADVDGWSAVTTRRLADAIGYSQPVLYGHFPGGKSEIMLAVAREGFVDLTQRCRVALGGRRGRRAIEVVAAAYIDFGFAHPGIYEVMFQQSIEARFASADTPAYLRAGFDALAAAVGDGDGTTVEVFWGALHGIYLLERAGRVRPEDRAARVAELSARFG